MTILLFNGHFFFIIKDVPKMAKQTTDRKIAGICVSSLGNA